MFICRVLSFPRSKNEEDSQQFFVLQGRWPHFFFCISTASRLIVATVGILRQADAARGLEASLLAVLGSAMMALCWSPPLARAGQVLLCCQLAALVVCWLGLLPLLGLVGPAGAPRLSLRLLWRWPTALCRALGCHRGCPCCARLAAGRRKAAARYRTADGGVVPGVKGQAHW